MKIGKITLATGFILLANFAVQSKTVTIYDSAGEELATVENVSKLSFSDTQMTITDAEGTAVWDFVDFAYLKFSGASGVMEVSNTGLRTYLDGAATLHISAPHAISNVSIYSVQGTQVAAFAPNAEAAEYSLAEYPSGIYVVRVISGTEQTIVKIVKK